MSNNVAPPKNTGGGGFVFENDVCAWLLAAMLVGEPVFGKDCGALVRLDFQTRPDGWLLDDILATTEVGGLRNRFALSVKSNAQFTAASAPSDFVEAAWQQWLHLDSPVFDANLDFLGLVTAPLSSAAAGAVSGLVEKARANDPLSFPSRLAIPNWASADERALFASFACPGSVGQSQTDVDTARMLQRLRFLQEDFGVVASQSENRALELCRRASRSQAFEDAQMLWRLLRDIASELRPKAGSLTLHDLVGRLRAHVDLDDYPDHQQDWATLDARSRREAALVRTSLAASLSLPREDQVAGILQSVADGTRVALLGASGVGKSGLAKLAFEQRASNGQRTLWLDASSLDRVPNYDAFEASLQLRNPLRDLLVSERSREPLVILDGLDRLYAEVSFRMVATFLQLVSGVGQANRWRVLVVCQSLEWPRLLEALQRAGAPVARWSTHEATALPVAELQLVANQFPSLGHLIRQPRVGALLANLKLLDLVVRRLNEGARVDASAWVGESSVAEWFWTEEVARGPERLTRGQFLRRLAQEQADQLVVSVSVDSFEPGSLQVAQSLVTDQLLVEVPGDRLAFAHDLYGDWVRLRVLLNQRDDLAAFLQTRYQSPAWHRAVRLLGIHLLEREDGVPRWRELMTAFVNSGQTVVRDLLLEAPAFSMNAEQLLESIFPDLLATDDELIRRLLNRFLAFATAPDQRMQLFARAVGADLNQARAAYRRPHWPYWVAVLGVLHAHREEALRVASVEVAKVVEMWLGFAPPGSVRRSEASQIGVLLGQLAVDSREDYRNRNDRGLFYRCALMAAPDYPEEVALLARTAAERFPRPELPSAATPLPRAWPQELFGRGTIRGPWAEGPLARVDEAFQSAVLDSPALYPLYKIRPVVAREVVLASLIEGPREEYWGGDHFHLHELDLVSRHRWFPALYTRGPFLACLLSNFDEGLELIMQLVDFATARASERARAARSRGGAEVDRVVAAIPLLGEGAHPATFEGDAYVFGWSSGLGNPPETIGSALMALEQYFYIRLDAGDDVTEEITKVLERSRSVAGLGVLCDIGKHQVSLFDGPLRALLSGPELYSWDIFRVVQGRWHLTIGGCWDGAEFHELARQFHGLQHRTRDLRDVATERLLRSQEMQEFFAAVRAWWKQRLADGEKLDDLVEQLDLRLDPTNYQVREDPTHGLLIVNVALERLQAERATEYQAVQDRALLANFPIRCRKILDERCVQSESQLEQLWQSWMRIRELARAGAVLPADEEGVGGLYLNALTGGIAVFLWHEEWLSQVEARHQQLEDALDSVLNGEPPSSSRSSSEHDVATFTWDCFVAESASMLWARQPQDARWRRLVAAAVFAEKYATVRLLFTRCAAYRATLGDDFGRLRRLALDWAHVRGLLCSLRNMGLALEQEIGERLLATAESWAEQAAASFVDGTLEPRRFDWHIFSDAPSFAEFNELRRPPAGYIQMDFKLVRCIHEWLPPPDGAQSPEERAIVVEFWRVALEVVVARPLADLHRRDQQHPLEDEVWVLENVAMALLQMRPDENPRRFWSAIIDLHSEAHDWPERFLIALHRHALAAEDIPASYARLVREITERALADVHEAQRWPRYEEVWDALIGIDDWVQDLWTARHTAHVLGIWDIIQQWMQNAPQTGRRLGKFARWLSGTAATPVRLRALPWLAEQLEPGDEGPVHQEEDVENNLARLLHKIWDLDQGELRSVVEPFNAFRALLAWLVERQNSLGLVLQGRIGGLD